MNFKVFFIVICLVVIYSCKNDKKNSDYEDQLYELQQQNEDLQNRLDEIEEPSISDQTNKVSSKSYSEDMVRERGKMMTVANNLESLLIDLVKDSNTNNFYDTQKNYYFINIVGINIIFREDTNL